MQRGRRCVGRTGCVRDGPAVADISDGVVRVGVLNDTSGIFQDTNGPGSVEAAKMAAEDFAGGGKNIKVEIVSGDHQNKADVGSAIVRRWLDVDKVDAVVDLPNSGVGLAVNSLARGTKMTVLASSTASSDLTGSQCSPNLVQWVTDTWSIANSTAGAMVEARRRFLVFPHGQLRARHVDRTRRHRLYREQGRQGPRLVEASARARRTISSLLLQAQNSGAKVVALANAGADTNNAVKQAAEYGMRERGQKLVAFLAFVNDVHAMGLKDAQGLLLTEAFYWDMNDQTRAFAKRFAARMGKAPSANQAGVYSATLAYLNAVAATGSDDAKLVVPQMKKAPFVDPLFGKMSIRQDGRALHNMYLFEVKKPEESKAPYDYYKLVDTVPAEQAFRPMAEGGCSLVK